jgi:uncharacterized phiE125 gp8 family phage protein
VGIKRITAPTIEPVTLSEVKAHLRIDSGTLADDITTVQVIKPDEHAIGVITSTGIDIIGYNVLVNLNAGTCSATGTLNVKIQDSDDGVVYTDWYSFAQVTTANDEAIYEKQYTGIKRYIRVVGTVTVDVSNYSVDIIKESPNSDEDDQLTDWITIAREYIENWTGKRLITQELEISFDDWPDTCWYKKYIHEANFISLPISPIQSITSITHYDEDNTGTVWTATEYFLDTYSETPRISLTDSNSWPTETIRDTSSIIIKVVAGYGDLASDVPKLYKQMIKLLVGHFYENREATTDKAINEIPMGIKDLMYQKRVWQL